MDKRRCSIVLENGDSCRAWALRSSPDDAPLCRIHDLATRGTLSAVNSQAAQKLALSRRAKTEARPSSDLRPGITLAEVLQVIAPALEAVDPFVGEPLWNVRLAAAGTLLASFPRYYRETPEKVNELLRAVLPEHVFDSGQHEAQKTFEAMRAEWCSVHGLRWSKLVGLYVRVYPSYMIGPWEDVAAIQKSRPAPVPAEHAPVMRLDRGEIALRRDNALPLLIPLEEPDDESVEVDAGVALAW